VEEKYIDVQDALKRVGGNSALYKNLLTRFAEGDQFKKFDESLEGGNKTDISHAAHAIKGVAANLSLIRLRDVSAALEQEVVNDGDHTARINEFRETYDATIQLVLETIPTL